MILARPPLPIGERGAIKRTRLQDGTWQALCRYRDTDGVTRRVKAYGPSGQKAENALKRKLKNRSQGETITSDTRLEVAAEYWFQHIEKSPGTRERYRRVLNTHIIPGVGKLLLRETTTARLEDFIRRTAVKGATGGPVAAKQARTVLSLVLGMCARYDAIPANPVRDTTPPAIERKRVEAMTPEQFQEFYADIEEWLESGTSGPKRNRDILDAIDLLVATGVRPGEMLAFTYSDVDFKAGTITVTGTIKRTMEQGLHRQEYTKRHSRPTLTLPGFALSILRRRKLASLGDLVFTNRDGGIWEPANFSRVWVAARGDKWSRVEPRSFRRVVATIIERENGSEAAADQLGHVNDRITKQHYIQRLEVAPDSTSALEAFRGRIRDGLE